MNNKIEYWKWKSTIIDFNNISDEKADFGDYWTKKEMVFHYLGTPDDGIHEWYNGGWSCEYNHALSYAKELGLVETYIDYDDELYNKDKEIERLKNTINKTINILELSAQNKGICTCYETDTIQSALKELKEGK